MLRNLLLMVSVTQRVNWRHTLYIYGTEKRVSLSKHIEKSSELNKQRKEGRKERERVNHDGSQGMNTSLESERAGRGEGRERKDGVRGAGRRREGRGKEREWTNHDDSREN